MINERRLKASMAILLENIKAEIPDLCKRLGAREKDVTVATVSSFQAIENMIDRLAED